MTGEKIHPLTLADSGEIIRLIAEESRKLAEVLLASPCEPSARQLAAAKHYFKTVRQHDRED